MSVDVLTRIVIEGPRDEVSAFAADPSNTTLLRNRGEPSGFAAVTAPVMTRAMRKANEADLRRLKDLLER